MIDISKYEGHTSGSKSEFGTYVTPKFILLVVRLTDS